MSGAKALKLRAEDDEDLAVFGACLKGAIGCLNEMAYDREEIGRASCRERV